CVRADGKPIRDCLDDQKMADYVLTDFYDATYTRLVFCRGRDVFHRRIQQQICLGDSGIRSVWRVTVGFRHKGVALPKSQASLNELIRNEPLDVRVTPAVKKLQSIASTPAEFDHRDVIVDAI